MNDIISLGLLVLVVIFTFPFISVLSCGKVWSGYQIIIILRTFSKQLYTF